MYVNNIINTYVKVCLGIPGALFVYNTIVFMFVLWYNTSM